MTQEQNREEIRGSDMKSYGNFDKFMDKAKRVSRYVLPGVAVALTASCTPEMINAIVTTSTPELSPLPSDFTKTPTPSPTEANYELTPTVQNPATQELTLASPTEVATEMPTLTLTPESTKVSEVDKKHLEYSPFYLPTEESKRSYVADVDGIKIPIFLGLTQDVTETVLSDGKSIYAIELNNQKFIDFLGFNYLYLCYENYSLKMGNKIEFEEYMQLLKNNEGNVDMVVFYSDDDRMDGKVSEIDPTEGFSVVITNKESLPLRWGIPDRDLYFGKDDYGRLLFVTNGFRYFEEFQQVPDEEKKYIPLMFIMNSVLPGISRCLAHTRNECMIHNSLYRDCKSKDFIAPTQDNIEDSISMDLFTELHKEGKLAEVVEFLKK